ARDVDLALDVENGGEPVRTGGLDAVGGHEVAVNTQVKCPSRGVDPTGPDERIDGVVHHPAHRRLPGQRDIGQEGNVHPRGEGLMGVDDGGDIPVAEPAAASADAVDRGVVDRTAEYEIDIDEFLEIVHKLAIVQLCGVFQGSPGIVVAASWPATMHRRSTSCTRTGASPSSTV